MPTGTALAQWFGMVDGDGKALALGDAVVQEVLDDDYEVVGTRSGTVAELPLDQWPVIEWNDTATREPVDPRSFTRGF